ncbi:hypothetical protein AAG906_025741 [Vitis piasezkii]
MVDKCLRGGRSRFVDSGGKLKGCIWERSRGFASWIRFGEASLRCLLEGVETYCREVDDQRWVIERMEGNRKFRMERRLNKAGREGSGQWLELVGREVERSWSDPVKRIKVHQCARGSIEAEGSPEVQWKEKGVETKGIMMFDFELAQEAERVLARGKRSIKKNFLILDKWNPEVGCSCKNSIAVETWVRVVGLPLHLWSLEVFKRIGDGCGGFIAMDEGTKSMSEMQWARILVKRADWEVVSTGSSSGKGGLRVGEEAVGSHRVAWWESKEEGGAVEVAGGGTRRGA